MKLSHRIAVFTCVITLFGSHTGAQETPSNISQTTIEASRTKASQAELASIAKAQEVREAVLTTPPVDASTGERLRSELRKLVLDAFTARHELQELEVKSLQQKARLMQTKLDQRQSNHTSIIDRRMEDLLNPELDWNAELASARVASTPQPSFVTPQELLAFLIKCSESNDYESYVSLLTDDAARDLAGMLLLTANIMMAQVDSDTKEYGEEAMSELMTSPFKTIPEALAHWSKPELTVQQKRVLENSRSTAPVMEFSGNGPNADDIGVYLPTIRTLAESITDHRKFAIEMMQALSQVGGTYPIFGNSGQTLTSEVQEESGDQATAIIYALDKTSESISTGTTYTWSPLQLQRIDGRWLISNLLDESHAGMFETSLPLSTTESATSEIPQSSISPPYAGDIRTAPANATVTTEIYHVGSIVTGSLFSKGIGLVDEKYFANQEAEIEKEMQSLVESITAACSSPPAMIKAFSSQRKLIVRHTPEGQKEIANLLTALGNSSDSVERKIRLRIDYVDLETILEKGIGVSGRRPTAKQADSIRQLFKGFSDSAGWSLDPQDQVVNSGAGMQFQLESSGALPLPVYARIMPGTQDVQIRLDLPQSDNRVNRPVLPFSLTLKDGESILVPPVPDSESWHFLVTVNIVTDATDEKSRSAGSSSNPPDSLAYSGKPVTYWLDAYWTASTPNEKTEATNGTRLTSMMAIAEFRERPECDAEILHAMSKWSASVANELSPNRLRDVAECITHVGGKRHQLQALEHLFKMADRMPESATLEAYHLSFFATHTVIDGVGGLTVKSEFKEMALNDELATLLGEKITSGTSKQRLFAIALLFLVGGEEMAQGEPSKAARKAWLKVHLLVLQSSLLLASQDENEEVRCYSALMLGSDFKNPFVRERLISMIESDPSGEVRFMAIESVASIAHPGAVDSLSSEMVDCFVKAVRSDPDSEIKKRALSALANRNLENEFVHQTLMEWARCEDPKIVMLALDSLYNGSTNGKRTQSVDELMELLSDPAWGAKIEVNRNNFNKHHRWARQYAIAVLGRYDSTALLALPILEAEAANKETATFAREAIDRISGYCSDLPVKSLQGKWQVKAIGVSPAGQAKVSPLLPFKADAEEVDRIIEIAGTQLLKDGKCIGRISHARGSSKQVLQIVLDNESEQLRLSSWIDPVDDGSMRDQYQLRVRTISKSVEENVQKDLYELHKVETD